MEEGLAESCYTLTDRESGRLLLLRPDVTLQIARMAGSARRGALPLPARFCCTTSVYRYEKTRSAATGNSDRRAWSSWASPGPREARKPPPFASSRFGGPVSKEFKVAVGQVEFFRGLFQGQKVPREIQREIRESVSKKDDAALDLALSRSGLPRRAAEAFRLLPGLFGKAEILARAGKLAVTPAARTALGDLRRTADRLDAYGVLPFIVFDLGEIRGFDYHRRPLRGVCRGRGNADRAGRTVRQPDRPVWVSCRATGFGLDVDLLVQALGHQGLLDEYAGGGRGARRPPKLAAGVSRYGPKASAERVPCRLRSGRTGNRERDQAGGGGGTPQRSFPQEPGRRSSHRGRQDSKAPRRRGQEHRERTQAWMKSSEAGASSSSAGSGETKGKERSSTSCPLRRTSWPGIRAGTTPATR